MLDPTDPLTLALQRWSEAFMQRSMGELHRFSRTAGLSMAQVNVLFRLKHMETCAVSDVSEHLGVTDAAASQLIQRLVEADYLERSEDPTDRRIRRLALTPHGRALVQELVDRRRQWMHALAAQFSEPEKTVLSQALQRLSDSLLSLDPVQTAPDFTDKPAQ